MHPPTPARSIRVHGCTRAFRARTQRPGQKGSWHGRSEKGRKIGDRLARRRQPQGLGERGSRQRERRHVAHTPSRRRLRLRGAYQPPSIISMRISIFHPVFPKFMQTSGARPLHLRSCLPSSVSALRSDHRPPSLRVPTPTLWPTYKPSPFVPVASFRLLCRAAPSLSTFYHLSLSLVDVAVLVTPVLGTPVFAVPRRCLCFSRFRHARLCSCYSDTFEPVRLCLSPRLTLSSGG